MRDNNDDDRRGHASTTLHAASTHWVDALTEAARNITLVASDLQDDWNDMSEALEAQG